MGRGEGPEREGEGGGGGGGLCAGWDWTEILDSDVLLRGG